MIDKTEHDVDDTCQCDYVGKDRFEVDMLPSLVNKIIGKSDSPKCLIFTDIKSSLRKMFSMESTYFEPEFKLPKSLKLIRKYSMCVVLFVFYIKY